MPGLLPVHPFRIAGVVLILLVLLFSAGQTGIDWQVFQHSVSTQPTVEVQCLAEALPPDALALFFSRLDGSLDTDQYAAQFGAAAYSLAPRILLGKKYPPDDLSTYPWLVAYQLPDDEIETFRAEYNLTITRRCGPAVVLGREGSP